MESYVRFLRACRCESVDRPPVWVMRQAGRYLPEYREHRAAHDFLEVCHTPDLAAEVTLQPLRRFPNLDAGIIFSDILVVPEAMGVNVTYPPGGPRLEPAISSMDDLVNLREADPERDMGYVGRAFEIVKRGMEVPRPVLGFAGAPFTLACYMTQKKSGDHGQSAKRLLHREPAMMTRLLDILTDLVADFLLMQFRYGADAVQLFDTWAGELSPEDYDRFVAPTHRRIMDVLASSGRPRILYVNGAAPFLERMADTGADVLGLDWRIDLGEARRRVGDGIALQGNVDPMLLYGPPEGIRTQVRRVHERLGGVGHIFNLGHGVLPDTPVEGVAAFVDAVAELAS